MPNTQIMFYHLSLESRRKSGGLRLKEKNNEQNTAFQSNILVAATTSNFQRVDDEEEDGAGAGDSDGTGFKRKDGRQ